MWVNASVWLPQWSDSTSALTAKVHFPSGSCSTDRSRCTMVGWWPRYTGEPEKISWERSTI